MDSEKKIKYYNGAKCTCSDFAFVAVEALNGGKEVGRESLSFAGDATPPNSLWLDALKTSGRSISIIKSPGLKVNNTFLNGVTGASGNPIPQQPTAWRSRMPLEKHFRVLWQNPVTKNRKRLTWFLVLLTLLMSLL